jgi:hypothetical protein
MREQMTYPSETVAPSISTEFVNGVKFDICEVIEEAHDMLYNSRNRFFLCVEDAFIYKYAGAEKFFASTGKSRWDMFCMTKGECVDLINYYQAAYESITSLYKKAEKAGFKITATARATKIQQNLRTRFGHSPV